MKIISFVNRKGGVCKTSAAFSFGTTLELKKNRKVLYVDLDTQGNLSYSFGIENGKANTILNLLDGDCELKDCIYQTDNGDIIPSDMRLDIVSLDDVTILKQKLSKVKSYDYCVIDTPPSLGTAIALALIASNEVIIPATPDANSVQGIMQILPTIKNVKKYNPKLKVRGILMQRYVTRSKTRTQVFEALEAYKEPIFKKFGIKLNIFTTKIRECTAMMGAQLNQEPIIKFSPKSNAALDYISFVDEYLEG